MTQEKITFKNKKLLTSFTEYCREHPGERFWQAIRNWSGAEDILMRKEKGTHAIDTFYFEGKNK